MHEFNVGTLYSKTRTSWPEIAEWNCTRSLNELRLFYYNPKPQEIQAISRGKCEFGLSVKGDIIFLSFRFYGNQPGQAGIPWSDAPYSYHMLPDDRKQMPDENLSSESRSLLQVVLVNANTGILLAIRNVTLSPEFTQALFQAIRDQAAKPFNQAAYDRQLKRIYDAYNSKQLFAAAHVKCEGGQ
ncbi:hypothetical protein [Dictyobacter arantiisoli]|uniref:Uncharacterized protein n=1 Tax=Dictyobacter arantiisoli TaxID=2014874 RepID=A0A5A5TJK4_9CHLR|nr:hypothetical protein [Dictyobacter arantiisoli]GCF11246.1 hypothetical protein KDI_48100 [Dictyobacter arantiisoli]